MTKTETIELCRIYNNSDIEALEYIYPHLTEKTDTELCEYLITLNNETEIGWGREPATEEEVDRYYKGKWQLLSMFGIENDMGDAKVDDVFYQ